MQITLLERERWKGHILPMPTYTAAENYAVRMCAREKGAAVLLELQPLDPPLVFTPEAYGCPDRLYADHFAHARAYGIFDGGALAAAIEICPEEWNNRLRVTELWVKEGERGRGLGKKLLAFAKEEGRRQKRRALVLETQSCNTRAIAFYLREGLSLIGLDLCSYSNEDVSRGEVRLELGLFL